MWAKPFAPPPIIPNSTIPQTSPHLCGRFYAGLYESSMTDEDDTTVMTDRMNANENGDNDNDEMTKWAGGMTK